MAALCSLSAPTARGQSATLAADTAIATARPSLNFGTLSNLYVNGDSVALLRFNLGTLPVNLTASQISRATLRVYVNRVNTPGVIGVAPVTSAWAESAVTAQTAPALGSVAQVAAITDEGQYVTLDITAMVQSWITKPSTNFGMALSATAADVVLDSKENDTTAHPAELQIALLSGTQGPAGPQGATGPQGPKGDTGAMGPTGLQGNAGPQGVIGLTGAQGPKGDKGDPGTGGGLQYRGAWSSTLFYAANDVVTYGGAAWVSTTGTNVGNAPSAGNGWGVLVPAASGGTVTTTGGLSFAGAYASTTNYAANAVVTFQSAAWVSLHDANHGNTPDASPADWTLLAAQGSTGPQGAQGVQGLQGPQGVSGPQGPKGDTGDTGSQGATGAPGMEFQGTYSSIANYALHDAVTYAGGTWISLQAANHGNAPGASPLWWQQIAAPGAQGSTGPQGAKGAVGDAGPQGPQGLVGPAGPQGQPVHFLGPWSATASYVTGDAVAFDGSAYIASAAVSGNQPGIAPAWQLLVQKGDTGATGSQGIQGTVGPQGPAGSTGAPGATGTPGLRWQGAWSAATGYVVDDAVSLNGSAYISTTNTNIGVTPGTSPQWSLLAAAGATGATGSAGANGVNGSNGAAATVQIGTVTTGPAGSSVSVANSGTSSAAVLNFSIPQGATGAAGTPGLTWQGAWSSGTGYSKGDVVFRNGSAYVSLHGANTADPVVSVTNSTGDWQLLVSQGSPGAATVAIGTVSGGNSAAVTNSGTQNAAVLNFTLPKGDAGAMGPAGLTYLGTWSAGVSYPATSVVTYAGSSYVALISNNSVHPVGDAGSATTWAALALKGDTGTMGLPGTTPTVAIAATHTGAAGTAAAVTNVGTGTDVRLDITIPKGDTGAPGAAGPAGSSGTNSGTALYTSVHTVPAGAAQFHSAVSDKSGASESGAVLTLLPGTCNLASVTVYNSAPATTGGQPTNASLTIRTGTPGNMAANPSAACLVAPNTATSCTGPGVLGTSNFVSFVLSSVSTVSTFLYTQFSCN